MFYLSLAVVLNRGFRDSVRALCQSDSRMADVAIGYAYFDPDISHIQAVTEQADAMMYRDKERQRPRP